MYYKPNIGSYVIKGPGTAQNTQRRHSHRGNVERQAGSSRRDSPVLRGADLDGSRFNGLRKVLLQAGAVQASQ